MMKFLCMLFVALVLTLFGPGVTLAQDTAAGEDEDGSSERVEQSDDSYRRQMELEDARSRDRTYVDNTYSPSADLEKIDKLPEESRDNIRDQLVDIIMENGEWEPKDALEEYPYTATGTAQSDPELKEQEQEAWDEQIEKYHEREAAAFGTYRGPVPGPGNPAGQEGGQEGGQQGDDSQQGGQDGQDGGNSGNNGDGSAGTYQPGQSGSNGSEEEVSTAGVSESALDFLRGGQGRQQPPPQGGQAGAQAAEAQQAQAAEDQQAEAQQAQAEATQQAQAEQQDSPQDIQPDLRGIIAIEDLDKLEGTEIPEDPEDSENP
jgi:hypothetical protein